MHVGKAHMRGRDEAHNPLDGRLGEGNSMRRQSAAVIGMAAMAITAGITPSASADQNGYDAQYTLFRTAGNVRCSVSDQMVACERTGPGDFQTVGDSRGHGQVASVSADGTFSWAEGGIPGSGQEIAMVNGQPYPFHKWTLLLTTEGTRLSHKGNNAGMNISIDGLTVTPY